MKPAVGRLAAVLARLPGEVRLAALLGLVLVWVYWPTLAGLAEQWAGNAQYSHGYLVPVFAALLCWFRRGLLAGARCRPSWWGLAPLAAGFALHAAGAHLYLEALCALSLLPCLAGLLLLAGGPVALRWGWPGVAFLLFMIPLPYRLAHALAGPLQRVGTHASVYLLQTLGLAAFAEGNVIHVSQARIGVVEACSGLSMLLIFFALSTAVALVVRRTLLEKVLLCASAVPIALAANITRIVATAVLHHTAGRELADLVFHDLAGWLMIPLALGLMWLELAAFSLVLVPRAPRDLAAAGALLWRRPGPAAKPRPLARKG